MMEAGPFDRYHRVGLRGNPFSVSGSDDPHEPVTGPWFVDRGLAPPPPPGSSVMMQIIGDQGTGKSTHLAEWRRRQPAPLHYIPRRPYRDRWRPAPVGPLVYGDEIDRMPRRLRRLWFRQLAALGATVAVGTHQDLSAVAHRAGFDTVQTHRLGPVSQAELAVVLDQRLRSAAVVGRAPAVAFTDNEVDLIHADGGGNLRAADSIAHRLLAERVRQVADEV